MSSHPPPDRQVKSSLLKTPYTPEISSKLPPEHLTWIDVCETDDTIIDGLYPYEVPRGDGLPPHPILLLRVNGELHALHDQCPHRRVSLSESGYLDGDIIYCGRHHWGFKVSTGEHTLPTGIHIEGYELREREGKIQIGM